MSRYALGGRERLNAVLLPSRRRPSRPSKLGGVELPPPRFSVITYELQN